MLEYRTIEEVTGRDARQGVGRQVRAGEIGVADGRFATARSGS